MSITILVVEDDDNKLTQLCSFLKEGFHGLEVRTARSLHGGLEEVRACTPDLVVLDMTLPNFDATPDDPGGQTHNFGGREFLKQLVRFDIKVPVIVVTQFITFGRGSQTIQLADLDRELTDSFGENYVGCVYYHASIHRWKVDLGELIKARLLLC